VRKILLLAVLCIACLFLVAADYNVSVSKSVSITMLKMDNVAIDADTLVLTVNYCNLASDGKRKDCDSATAQMDDATVAAVMLKAKKAMKDKEGVK
jgi:hypothetical protein